MPRLGVWPRIRQGGTKDRDARCVPRRATCPTCQRWRSSQLTLENAEGFDLFDQRPESGKPVEIPLEDGYTLVLDGG